MRYVASFALLISLVAAPALAEDASCTALVGGTVYVPEGPRERYTVVLLGDRVADVGSEISALVADDSGQLTFRQQTCTAIQLSSTDVVTPGLVTTGGALGLVEIGMEDGTRHHDASGDEVRAAHDVADSYNPRSSVIPVQRITGITSAIVEPTGGMVSGQSAWVDLAGGTQAESIARRSVAMPAAMVTPSRAEGIRRLRELLDDARVYASDRRAYAQNRSRPFVASRLDLEALQPVLKGDVPLVIGADRAADIEALLRFADAEGIELVIRGGAEAWLHADALADAGVAVIVNPYVYGAGSFDQIEARPDGPALLVEAGVPVIISTQSAHFARGLRQMAGNAVRGGMDHTAALRSITSTPAEVFGMTDRGEVARGAYANVVVWSGDPLEISSTPTHIFIGGRPIPLQSRQTELLERYRDLPGSPVPSLTLPGTETAPPKE